MPLSANSVVFLEMTILAESGVTFFEHEKSACAFILYSGTVCVHFYSFQALSVCISIISQHFSPCAFLLCSALSACISTTLQHSLHAFLLCLYVFVCVCLYAFVCVVLYVFVCVCMSLYVFYCVCMCLYVFVCVLYVFVFSTSWCVCMCLYVCVCMCLRSINSFFFTSISTVFQHFCLSQLDLPVCTIVQRTCAEKATCACDLISIAHWSYWWKNTLRCRGSAWPCKGPNPQGEPWGKCLNM